MVSQGEIAAATSLMSLDAKSSSSKSVFGRGPQTTQRIRLTTTGLRSASSGIAALAATFDPTSFTDYSSVASMYGEIRIRKARITLVPYRSNTTSDVYKGIAIATDMSLTTTTPTVGSDVWSIEGCRVWYSASTGQAQSFEAKIPAMSWASTASPAPGPYAGCYGQFSLYGQDFATSQTVFQWYLECEYEVRNRR